MKKINNINSMGRFTRILVFAMLVLSPFTSFSQGNPPIPGDGGGAGNPDPSAVPIDGAGYLLIAGLVFAAVVTVKQWQQKDVANK